MKAPEELEGDALLCWGKYVKEIAKAGRVTNVDRAALITLCRATALKENAARNIEQTGSIIKLPNGYPAPTPFLKVFFEAAKLEKAMLVEFGLTRASRAKIKPPVKKEESTELSF